MFTFCIPQVLMLLLKASCEFQQESRQCCGASLESGGQGNVVSGGQDRTEVTRAVMMMIMMMMMMSGEHDGGGEERQEVTGGELHWDDEAESEH